MKPFRGIIILIGFAVVLNACGGAETKVDPEVMPETTNTAPVNTDAGNRPVEENVARPESRSGVVDSQVTGEKHEILRNIDRHLVSTQTASDRLTVENTLQDVDFDRVIVEVNELDGSGKIRRTNFYQITNLDAGSKKVVKITPPAAGTRVELHIVKAKSQSLTEGAMILVGNRYSPES